MGSRRDLALVVTAIVAVVVLALLTAADPEQSALDPRPSSFRAAAPGTLALYLTLQELGVPVERRLTSWTEREPLDVPLVLLAPSQPLTPFELEQLIAWLDAGGSLLYAARPDDPLLEALGLDLEPHPATAAGRPRAHAWTQGTARATGFRLAFAASSRALAEAGAAPLLVTDDGQVLALHLRVGEGSVAAWSDVEPLTNRALRERGTAVSFTRAAVALAGGEVLAFDEFHHGYREGAGVVTMVVRFLRDTAPGHAVLQLGVAGLGLLVLLGRRFGAAYPPPAARRRSPLEHVEALAGAYRQGGARSTARRQVIAGLARRLGRPAPAAGAEAEWLRALGARQAVVAEPLESLLAEWNRSQRADLTAVARDADRIVARLRHHRSSNDA